jgi:hypothetical protein
LSVAKEQDKLITLHGQMEYTQYYGCDVTLKQSDLRKMLKEGYDLDQILDETFTVDDIEFPDSKPGWGAPWDFKVVSVTSGVNSQHDHDEDKTDEDEE